MHHYKETYETWNKIAEIYQDKFMNLAIYNDTYDYFCDNNPNPKAKILEIGCGPGNISKYLNDRMPEFDILGIDVAPNMIELAKINVPKANFIEMDCRNISELSAKYDGIICGFCLPYLNINDAEKLIQDISNSLNKNGIFYLSFVEGDEKDSGFKTGTTGNRVYFNYYNLAKLKNILLAYGFEVVKEYKIEYVRKVDEIEYHNVLIARNNL